jgi:hypothetical protein
MREVVAGASLARYGDGEFGLCAGRPIKCERGGESLTAWLRLILHAPPDAPCLVGVPNIRSATPKIGYWKKYERFAHPFLADRPYVSAFVTRPDSAPWVDQTEFWRMVESLWKGRHVTLVRGSCRSFTSQDLTSALSVHEILGPPVNAWSDYDRIRDTVGSSGRTDIVLLSLGPAATVMAYELAARGLHAVDIGHLGMFWRKHLRGEPMIRTDADKVAV